MNPLTDLVVPAQPPPTPDAANPQKGTLKILTFSVRESKGGYPYLVGRETVPLSETKPFQFYFITMHK